MYFKFSGKQKEARQLTRIFQVFYFTGYREVALPIMHLDFYINTIIIYKIFIVFFIYETAFTLNISPYHHVPTYDLQDSNLFHHIRKKVFFLLKNKIFYRFFSRNLFTKTICPLFCKKSPIRDLFIPAFSSSQKTP